LWLTGLWLAGLGLTLLLLLSEGRRKLQCLTKWNVGNFGLSGDFHSSFAGQFLGFREFPGRIRQSLSRLLLGRGRCSLWLACCGLTFGLRLPWLWLSTLRLLRLWLTTLGLTLGLRLSAFRLFPLRLLRLGLSAFRLSRFGLSDLEGFALLGDFLGGFLLDLSQLGNRLSNLLVSFDLLLAGRQIGGGPVEVLRNRLFGRLGLRG
jgi:hypothetical protein